MELNIQNSGWNSLKYRLILPGLFPALSLRLPGKLGWL